LYLKNMQPSAGQVKYTKPFVHVSTVSIQVHGQWRILRKSRTLDHVQDVNGRQKNEASQRL